MKTYPVNTLTPDHPDFPSSLLTIKPKVKKLYYSGTFNPNLFQNTLAIVGSRRSTTYGHQVIKQFIPLLIQQNITIVSGFMYGIDTLAHQETLNCGGQTIAVLGSGLNHPYPPENNPLFSQIIDNNGLIISEFEPDFKPTLWSFPQRNRIVSGLSTLGVLIIEANHKSGSLITARLALKQNKPLFCIPGPITSSLSSGTNQLIKTNQAQLVTSPQDIVGIKQLSLPSSPSSLSPLEQKIIDLVSSEPLTIDELSPRLHLSVSDLSIQVSLMSLNNLVEEINGKVYPVHP